MAIKDRITKKTTKTQKTTGTKRKAKLRSGIEVLDFFEMNKDLSGLYIYDNNSIYLEKDGAISLADEVFEISISDLIRVIEEKYKTSAVSVGDSLIIQTENGTIINIISKPYLKSGSFISFRKKKMYEFSLDYFLKHQTISPEISDFLKEKLKNKENIFVAGSFDTNKLPILSYLSGLTGENTALLQGTDEILTASANSLSFSKTSLSTKELISKAFALSHKLVISECEDFEQFMTVLEYINSGYKHFVSALNISSKAEFISSIKNYIMLNLPQMSEDKIEGLISSTIKNIVFLEKMKDGETRISHISEFKEGKIKDIFEFDFGKFSFIKSEEKEEKPEEDKTEQETEEKPKRAKRVVIRKKRIQKTKKQTKTKKIKAEETTKQEEKEEGKPEEIKEAETEIKTEEVKETVIPPEAAMVEEITIQNNLPETVIEPMKQLTPKVNKYKLLKEKIRQRREQG